MLEVNVAQQPESCPAPAVELRCPDSNQLRAQFWHPVIGWIHRSLSSIKLYENPFHGFYLWLKYHSEPLLG